jgi:hypothetical protein
MAASDDVVNAARCATRSSRSRARHADLRTLDLGPQADEAG